MSDHLHIIAPVVIAPVVIAPIVGVGVRPLRASGVGRGARH
jgi:hypothetical protein